MIAAPGTATSSATEQSLQERSFEELFTYLRRDLMYFCGVADTIESAKVRARVDAMRTVVNALERKVSGC